MNNMTRLRIAVDILSSLDQFKDTTFIAELRWIKIPEAYNFRYSIITNGSRLSVYQLEGNTVVDIVSIGVFQIT